MSATDRPEVIVVGAGIAGLVAAYELTGGEKGPGDDTPLVTVIDAADSVGGKLSPISLDGRILDAGADGALARRDELIDLCREIGISGELTPVAASGASVFARGRLRDLPADLQLGIPTRFSSLRRSKVLSPLGLLRVLRDVVIPVPASRGPLQDRAIGALISTKLGPEVVATLVDPMIGGINAGRVSEMSAAAIFPPLLEAAQRRGGLMKALRRITPAPPSDDPENPPAPAFVSITHGMHSLPTRLAEILAERGVRLYLGVEVTSLDRRGGTEPGWAVNSPTTTTRADAVVLAVPADAAARLLEPHDADAASLLAQIDYASVAVTTFELDAGSITLPEHGTGALVPPGTKVPSGPGSGDRFLTTALTFLDRKWPHLHRDGAVLLRVHSGRIDDDRIAALSDDELIARLYEELGAILPVSGKPLRATVKRWDHSLPQYRVNHLMRVGGIESGVNRLPLLGIAGAAYHGVGVPACIASGRSAGRQLLEAVSASTR